VECGRKSLHRREELCSLSKMSQGSFSTTDSRLSAFEDKI
jgi:hypothetical protein